MSHDVYALADRVVEERAALAPHEATFGGVTGYDDCWPDLSPDGTAHQLEALRRLRAETEALPPGEDGWSRLAIRGMADDLTRAVDWFERGEHLLDLNSVSCPVQDLRTVMDVADTDSAEGWEALATRLDGFSSALAGYQATLEDARQQGTTVARRQVEAAIEQAKAFSGPESSFRTIPEKLAEAGTAEAGFAERVELGVKAACVAYSELAEYVEKCYLPSALEGDAVGEERYVP